MANEEKSESERLSDIWITNPLHKDSATAQLLHEGVFELCPAPDKDRSRTIENVFEPAVSAFKSQLVTLSWQNITIRLPTKKRFCNMLRREALVESRLILNNVTGLVRPGTLLAVMGASGAGKTAFLNVLSHTTPKNMSVDGQVCVNGVNLESKIRNISAYVQSEDMFIGRLTVKEHLTFRALLRMDKSISKKARLQRVDDVIKELGLTKCADSIIGVAGRVQGISSGEKKRLAFASEALTSPPLMFCDEPTSGLDSYMSRCIVQTLKLATKKDQTMICTIHQPSSEIFELFDDIMLLSEGRVAYMGPAKDAIEFFSSQGFQCPQNYNPADFYIHTLFIVPGEEAEGQEQITKICDAFNDSDMNRSMEEEIFKINAQANNTYLSIVSAQGDRFNASLLHQLQLLYLRCLRSSIREPLMFRGRFLQICLTAIIFGLFFYRQEYNQEGVMNINGALFIIIMSISFQHLMSALLIFPYELPVFLREYGIGLYRVDAYFICKTTAELPLFVMFPFVYASISYWMIGLQESVQAFLVFAGLIIIVANTSNSYGYMMSSFFLNPHLALMVGGALVTPNILLSGFLLNTDTLSEYLRWLKYISWFKHSMTLVAINQ